jgi:hypothetical protein
MRVKVTYRPRDAMELLEREPQQRLLDDTLIQTSGGRDEWHFTDPAEGMIGVLFTQRMTDSPEPPKVSTDF